MTTEPDHSPPSKNPGGMSWETMDHLDWQLWVLAILLIAVLGASVLSLMFPAVFWPEHEVGLKTTEPAFWGFGVLLSLTLAYLLQKQSKLRRLKRALVTERKGWEQELIHNALYDTLTSLPNRALLLDRLRLSVLRSKRHQDYRFAVIFFDLDRFKIVNDSMGHRIGDQVLVEVAQRLQRCLRAEDTVARLGGDEFGILLEDVKQMTDVSHTMERVRKELLAPFILEGREVFASGSMGIVMSSSEYEQAEDLLRDADTAMYRAKAQGAGQHEIFDATMHEHAVKVLTLETDLRRAIDRRELILHYQPIVWLGTGKVSGLARISHQ